MNRLALAKRPAPLPRHVFQAKAIKPEFDDPIKAMHKMAELENKAVSANKDAPGQKREFKPEYVTLVLSALSACTGEMTFSALQDATGLKRSPLQYTLCDMREKNAVQWRKGPGGMFLYWVDKS